MNFLVYKILPTFIASLHAGVFRGSSYFLPPHKRLVNRKQHFFRIVFRVVSDQSLILKLSVERLNTTHKLGVLSVKT